MNKVLLAALLFLSGCVSFESAYNEVNAHQIRRDSQLCVDKANLYAGKIQFSSIQKSEMFILMGKCYSQIGLYDDALKSFGEAVEVSSEAESRSKALFQRATLLFSMNDYNPGEGKNYVESGCTDIAEACRLVPGKYCNEYNIKKQLPTKCR